MLSGIKIFKFFVSDHLNQYFLGSGWSLFFQCKYKSNKIIRQIELNIEIHTQSNAPIQEKQ